MAEIFYLCHASGSSNGAHPHEKEKPAFSNSSSFLRRFRKALFSRRISVDGTPNPKNKAACVFRFLRRSVFAASVNGSYRSWE